MGGEINNDDYKILFTSFASRAKANQTCSKDANDMEKSIFKEIDKNGNGVLEQNEINDAQQKEFDKMNYTPAQFNRTVRDISLNVQQSLWDYYLNEKTYQDSNFIFADIFFQVDINGNGKIEKEEINRVMQREYDYETESWGATLLDKIVKNTGTKFKHRFKQIYDQWKARNEDNIKKIGNNSSSAPNGKIDDNFKQGCIGDCWILASILAKVSTPEGLKEINDMLSVDENGNVTVTIDDTKYTYTPEDLKEYLEYSYGDMDVRALELAIEEHLGYSIKKGGYVHNYNNFKALEGADKASGQEWERKFHGELSADDALRFLDKNRDKSSGESYSVVGATHSEPKKLEGINVIDESGNLRPIPNRHAIAIVDYDDKYVYLNDPHSGTEKLKITHEDFRKAFNHFSYSENGIKDYIPHKMKIPKLDIPENTNPFS